MHYIILYKLNSKIIVATLFCLYKLRRFLRRLLVIFKNNLLLILSYIKPYLYVVNTLSKISACFGKIYIKKY